ncbi:apolipoprotein N-acyltransferase [Pseudomonas profundi]|uniref:apolipoprotein N-acyltransferase n=1 Tax=Pseudomonas profundi TaxID=1981513 RepID=UPI001238E7DD|nr:apolipoprotein N-acyltransferase [Pseudomonas profundi]
MNRLDLSIAKKPFDDASAVASAVPLACRIMLAALSGALLCIPWLIPHLYWTAWLGWVPLLFALDGTRLPTATMLGWVAGTVCFAGASNWMVEFAINLKALSFPLSLGLATIFWLYAGLSVGLACLVYRWLARALPGFEVLTFTFSILAIMAFYPLLFEARFAEAQTQFLPGLQGVDLVGAQGMDAIMLMVSGLVFHVLRRSPIRSAGNRAVNIGAAISVFVWFIYGFASLQAWDERTAEWETRRVGLVQPNDAVTLDLPKPAPGFSLESPEEMLATERLIKGGATWVAWPEARYKGYFENYSVRYGYAQRLSESGVPLVFHDVENRWIDGERQSFNSVAFLGQDGELADTYRKVQRMPFGEYLPAFFHLPGLRTISNLFLGEFLRELSAGDRHAYFNVGGMQVVPKVCFETAFPEFVADSVGADGEGKVLLFLSQDNWFGETTQPFQHRAMSIVRGVENRVPMIHLINNGPSVVSSPNGRIIASSRAFSRAEMLVDIPFSTESGGSFYSRHPHLFGTLVYVVLGLLVTAVLAIRRRRYTTSPAL